MLALGYLYFQTYYILPPVFPRSNLQTFFYKIIIFQAPSGPNQKCVTIPLQELPRWLITPNNSIPKIQYNQPQEIRFFFAVIPYQSVLQVSTK